MRRRGGNQIKCASMYIRIQMLTEERFEWG